MESRAGVGEDMRNKVAMQTECKQTSHLNVCRTKQPHWAQGKESYYEDVGKRTALLSLNVTDCKDESEEDLEIMVKSCYLLLQVEKLKPVMEGLKLEFA